jgi:DNA-binding response OmpR family regulator
MFPPRAEAAAPVDVRTDISPDSADLLRVGPLELDLVSEIDRPARRFGKGRRGDRSFDLRPREFRLLKYMMQRAGQLLTREALLKDVWHYKFVPETTILIDVHIGKLRRKIDGSNEAPMIRNVRGAGFILNATDEAAIPRGPAGKAVQA